MKDINTLKAQAASSWQRRLLLLAGDKAQHLEQAKALFTAARQPLWLGGEGIKANEARHYLGQECDLLVVDWHSGLHLNALGALSGCLSGGGLLVLLTPPLALLAAQSALGAWLASQLRQFQQHAGAPYQPVAGLTADQQQALAAGIKVLSGHRGRPLVLTADRGRGKTALLGTLAAEALKAGRSPVVVTAPRFEALAPLFAFAKQQLPSADMAGQSLHWQGHCLHFYPPDRLLAEKPEAALLLVDEAAAIPTPQLDAFASHYKRLVFSSTLHGYEGSGRGFALRFLPKLKARYPGTQQLHLTTPVRWAPGCPVEKLVNQLLLLAAEPDVCPKGPVALHWLTAAELVARPTWLKAAMGLLVSAHYQTSPADIEHWLTDPAVQFVLACRQDKVLGVVALVAEGGLDAELCQAIYLGQRRPKGHLVLQSLSSHMGFKEAPSFTGMRVMRIAVSEQRQGLGSWLLEELERRFGLLLVSFAGDTDLVRFWRRAGWQPLRLGTSVDAASGLASVMMAKAQTDAAAVFVSQVEARFWETLPWQQPLPKELINGLFQGASSPPLSSHDQAELKRFAQGGGSIDTLRLPLWRLGWHLAAKGQCPALLLALLSGTPIKQLGPRKAVLTELRRDVAQRVP
ncbi:GNAT family N-acetyltransferase [Gallaecimonas mangrovi]|uniref:GNAT family N-acetyltransferase n=1 Tax=Gallaecimonas mangrovi TaxID=2291597 RepID=UPI000E2071C1|nr:GNAT family N-acetyltransferase [Gallaecimonas mangrovi]